MKYQKALGDPATKSGGLDVKLVEVKDGVHIDLDMTTQSKDSIIELIEE